MTDAGVVAVVDGCPGLQRLAVMWNDELFEEGPAPYRNVTDIAIGKALELNHLEHLTIYGCAYSRDCVMRLAREPDLCPSLRQLFVSVGDGLISSADQAELVRARTEQIQARAEVPAGETAEQKRKREEAQAFRVW